MRLISSLDAPEFIRSAATWLYNEWGRRVPGRSIETAEVALKQETDSAGLPVTLIAVDDSAPVGVARLVENDLPAREDLGPWLASVYVPPEKRRCGIGTELCAGIVEQARKLGFKKIFLFTPDKSQFYHERGWSKVGTESHWLGSVTVMEINVSEQAAGAL